MLSFQRDQNYEDLPAQRAAESTDSGTAETGYIPVAANKGKVRQTTAALAVLLVVGLVCVWFMVKKTAPQAAQASNTDTNELDVAKAISRLTGVKSEMFEEMDQIVDKFYEFSEVPQVQVDELVKNPFELELFLANLKAQADALEPTVEIDLQAIRRQKMNKQAEDLVFMTIMHTKNGKCCMINGKVLREGDVVDGFKVASIADKSVKLLWNDDDDPAGEKPIELILSLSDEE